MAAKPWVNKPLTLPVGEKTYEVAPVSWDTGLTLIKITQEGVDSKMKDTQLFKMVMGDTWDEMLADGCPFPVMFRAGIAAFQYQSALVIVGLDSDQAVVIGEQAWESGVDPEKLAAALKAHAEQTAANSATASTNSRSSASGSKTPRPASTRTTTSRPGTRSTKSKPSAAKPVPATRRGRSSPTVTS